MIDQESKNISTTAYILPIGFLVAYAITHICGLQNKFITFHLRQSFGINLLFFIFWLIFNVINVRLLAQIFMVVYVLIAIYAIIGVRNEKRLYLPFTGKMFDETFTFIN